MSAYAEVFNALNQQAESGWLKSQRIAAFARFEHLGFPTPDVEHWKYTDTKLLARRDFQLARSVDLEAARQLLADQGLVLDAHRLVFVNGRYAPELSDLQGIQAAVVIEPLSAALENELELTCGMMGRLAGIDVDVFTALNFAFAEEGAVIRVGDRQQVQKPVLLSWLSTAAETSFMAHPRVLVAVGASSQLSLVEEFIGQEGARNFTNRVAEVVMERNAEVKHHLLQQASEQEWWVGRVQVEQKRDSRYSCHHMNLGGKLVRDDLVLDLNGEGAECHLSGLLFGRNRQHLDIHSLINHNAAHTLSSENYKSILNDRARGVFNGKVIVKRDSQKINAQQSNANLLLSDEAEIDTKPELEIYADDVKCSHGATTGQLDQDALFYLRARGVDEALARGLLTLAFANEVIDRLEIPAIHQRVETTVAGYLPQQVDLDLSA